MPNEREKWHKILPPLFEVGDIVKFTGEKIEWMVDIVVPAYNLVPIPNLLRLNSGERQFHVVDKESYDKLRLIRHAK